MNGRAATADMRPLRIAIIASAPLVQAGLSRIVDASERFELAAVAVSIHALRVSLVRQPALQIDVAILDSSAADDPVAITAALDAGIKLV
ncbi:MAG TPA: hypothetical protein VEN28_07025, partial [Burkholderiaceae bacterium]|nr:hypothetical protein [Burkholderiaceae bacterium]